MVASSVVQLFPPRLFYRILVSLLSRYGTCGAFIPNFITTFPRAVKLDLMLTASSNLVLSAVDATRSLPARSNRFKIPLMVVLSSSPRFFYVTVMLTMVWLREEMGFISVSCFFRSDVPFVITAKTSSAVVTGIYVRSFTYTYPLRSSWISNAWFI